MELQENQPFSAIQSSSLPAADPSTEGGSPLKYIGE